MPGIRFTAYMSEDESNLLRRVAKDNGTSVNFVVRTAILQLLNLPAPLLHVTSDTPKRRVETSNGSYT